MSTLHVCLLFTGLSFCLAFAFLSCSLFTRLSLRFFLFYLFLEALNFTFEWLLVHPSSPYKAAWLAFMMASSFWMAPCVWLFARETHENKPPQIWPFVRGPILGGRIAWGQITVVVVGFLLTVPLLFAAHEGTQLVDHSQPRTYLSYWIHTSMVAAVLLYLVQVPWYLRRCFQLLKERVRLNKAVFSTLSEPALNALRTLMGVMVADWILALARTLHVMLYPPSEIWHVFFSACEVGVIITALYIIMKRCWHYDLDDQRMLQTLSPQTEELKEQPSKKYVKSSLDESTRTRVLKRVLAQFEEEKLYRNNNLKLKDLCDATNESPHYVSQVINQSLELSFFDLVNRYRIKEAKIKLKQSTSTPVLDIALEVGFNSKSTFNKVFKEATGQTPSAYRS